MIVIFIVVIMNRVILISCQFPGLSWPPWR